MKDNLFLDSLGSVLEKLPINYAFVKAQEDSDTDFDSRSVGLRRFHNFDDLGINEYVAPSFYKEISKTIDLNEE